MNTFQKVLGAVLWLGVAAAMAQSAPPVAGPTVPQNIVQFSASSAVEVPQDLLSVSMNTTREGSDVALVQSQLKAALDAALGEAKKVAQPGQLEVRTGNFSLYPRYGRDGKISGWQGSTELVLEGRDFARISSTAGKIQTLSVGQVGFGLSRELRAKAESDAQTMAIEQFKVKAMDIAKGFGFAGYTLREIAVHANDQGPVPRPRLMAMEAKAAAAEAPLPVEAGKSTVRVTVSGAVQLR